MAAETVNGSPVEQQRTADFMVAAGAGAALMSALRELAPPCLFEDPKTRQEVMLSRFCAHYWRNTGLLSRDVTH